MGRGLAVRAAVAAAVLGVGGSAGDAVAAPITIAPSHVFESSSTLDDAGNAHFAWRDSSSGALHVCRLPAGATACQTATFPATAAYVPQPLLLDPADPSQVRLIVEPQPSADNDGSTAVLSSSDGGKTYGAPSAAGHGIILADLTERGPGAFSYSKVAFTKFLSGPLDGGANPSGTTLVAAGGNNDYEAMGIGFPDALRPLVVWNHTDFDNNSKRTIAWRRWTATGSVDDASTWTPLQDYDPPHGVFWGGMTNIASGPKGVFVLISPQAIPGDRCEHRPEVMRYDPDANSWGPPQPIDDDPHDNVPFCSYSTGLGGDPLILREDEQGVLHVVYRFDHGTPTSGEDAPRGLQSAVSFDGGLTWSEPIPLPDADTSFDSRHRLVVNAQGDGVLMWERQADNVEGHLLLAARMPPLSAYQFPPPPPAPPAPGGGSPPPPGGSPPPPGSPPPGPTGPCTSTVTVGPIKALAAQGCFVRQATKWVATGPVRVNGIDLIPRGGSRAATRGGAPRASAQQLTIDTATRVIAAAGDWQAKVGSVDLGTPKIDWKVPSGGGTLVDAATNAAVMLAIPKGQTLLGLPVNGTITPVLQGGRAQLPMNLQLPPPLGGLLGGPLTDDITFAADVAQGLRLDKGTISIKLPTVSIGPATISPFSVLYDADPFTFEADLGVQLPGTGGALHGHLNITNGEVVDLAADVKPFDPGIPVATGVFLTRVGFHLHKGQSCQDQTNFGLSVGLSGGPSIAGTALFGVDGGATYYLPEGSCNLPARFRVSGSGNLVGLDVGDIFVQYTTPAKIEFGADIRLGKPSIAALEGSVAGGLDAGAGEFYLEGRARVTVIDYKLAEVDVIGSNIGLGACAALDLLPGIPGGLAPHINAGAAYLWRRGKLILMPDDCNVKFLKPQGFQGRAAQAGEATFAVAAGTKAQTFVALGHDRAPSFTLTAPDGTTYTPPAPDQRIVRNGGVTGLTLDDLQEAALTIRDPKPGTWRLTPAGDEPIATVETARAAAPPKVTAHVRRLHGRRLRLTYRLQGGAPDARVELFERGAGAQHSLGTLTRRAGHLDFTAAAGAGGRREIVAIPHAEGALATSAPVVARFTAPRQGRPPRPRHVSLVRGRSALRVSWRRAPGAKGYVVRSVLRDGRRAEQQLPARRRSLILPRVPGADSGTITVYAIGPGNRVSRGAKAVLHRKKAHKRRRHAVKRRPHRSHRRAAAGPAARTAS